MTQNNMNLLSTLFSYFTCPAISLWEKIGTILFYVVYVLSPIDLIPDIPVIGWIDDIGIGALLLAFYAWRVNNALPPGKKESPQNNSDVIDVTPIHTETTKLPPSKEPFFKDK